MDSAGFELSAAVIRWSALVSGGCAGVIFIDLCLIKRGFEKAVEMLERGEEKGVFVWAPRLRYWLKDIILNEVKEMEEYKEFKKR